MFPVAAAALMAFQTVKTVAGLARSAKPVQSALYGIGYASGTVLGYHGTSQFFKPKWKYLGSPQRVSKL